MKTEDAPEDERLAQSNSFNYLASPPIRVVVDDTNAAHTELFVHQSLICPRSKFFVEALTGLSFASKERTVSLPDCDPEAVSQYIMLLYTEKLPPKHTATNPSNAPDKYFTLSKLYVLALKLIDAATQSTVLDELCARGQEQDENGMHDHPSLSTIRTIYCSTSTGSEARKWLVDLYTNHIGAKAPLNLFPAAKDFPQQFLADLVSRTINFCSLPTQLLSVKNDLTATKTQAHAHYEAKLQLGAQYSKTEAQLKEKLAQTEALWKGACKGIATMQSTRDQAQKAKATLEDDLKKARAEVSRAEQAKSALEEDLRKARTEVALLKRRPESTGISSVWDRPGADVYRPR